MKKRLNQISKLTTAAACLGVALGGVASGMAADASTDPSTVEKLTQENQELKARMDALELLAQKEGLLPSGKPAPKFVSSMSDITISGFVQASYFYNTDSPSDGYSDGYLWNTRNGSFSINKVKVTIASKPVETDKWDAGFRTSLMYGEDAPVLNTGGENQGLEELREAYVELNAPLGTGLNIKAGQLISLLNWESGDGGAANPNFSQGHQWFYTGNGPSACVQVGYEFTEKVGAKFRIQNGMYAGAIDNNQAKTYMGSVNFKPNDALWFNVIGFGGNEASGLDVAGFSTLGGYKVTEKLGTGFEYDYFDFDSDGNDGVLWSIGGWVWYDLTPTLQLAFRGEFLNDGDGVGILNINLPGRPNSAITSTDSDGNISSLTLTATWMPAPRIRIQPEIRYDMTDYTDGYDGQDTRFTIGAGVSYLF